MAEETKDEDTLVFSLERKKRPVILIFPDNSEKKCFLKEMTGTLRDRWMGQMSKRVDGKAGKVTNFDGLMAELIGSCLTFADTDLPVPVAEIQAFPSSVQEALFKVCQKMNGLEDKSVEAEKKE